MADAQQLTRQAAHPAQVIMTQHVGGFQDEKLWG